MQANSGDGAHRAFGTLDMSTEPTSPMDIEQHRGCQSCTGSGKKNESRPAHRSRAAASEGDRTSVKLRNSCRACADSKVRCDREKPRCSRCDTRDLACEYLQSKRPGRVPGTSLRQAQAKQAVKKSGQAGESTAQPASASGNSNRDTSLDPSPFRLEDFALDLGQQHTRGTTPAYSTPSMSHVDGNTATSSPGRDAELGDFFACNAPVAPMAPVTTNSSLDDALDMVAMDFFWPMEDDYGDFVDMDLANFANIPASPHASHGSVLAALSQPSTAVASSSSSLSTSDRQDLLGMMAPSLETSQPANAGPSSNSNSPSCTCMARALELLRTLSANDTPDTASTASDQYAQRVLLDNKEAIDASLAMLACRACSNDRFLLMVLLMNAVKILTRYTSAAALCRSCTPSSTLSTSDSNEQTPSMPDHTNQLTEISRAWGCVPTPNGTSEPQITCREAVQRVLRELHRLQRLLAQLTLRRESLRGGAENRTASASVTDSLAGSLMMRERSSSQLSSRPATSHGGAGSGVLTPHLHDNALGLVEDDVRNGLGVLSAVIRDLLNNC